MCISLFFVINCFSYMTPKENTPGFIQYPDLALAGIFWRNYISESLIIYVFILTHKPPDYLILSLSVWICQSSEIRAIRSLNILPSFQTNLQIQ